MRELDPITVYLHNGNTVVVQAVVNGVEEGKYITSALSSYSPQSGDDGFEFEPNPEDYPEHAVGARIYEYTRIAE